MVDDAEQMRRVRVMLDAVGRKETERFGLYYSIVGQGWWDSDEGETAVADVEQRDNDLIYAFGEEDDPDHILPALETIFVSVVAFAEGLHGPLDRFMAGEYRVLTGEWVLSDEEEKGSGCEHIADGKRAYGGALERFFQAHHRLMRQLRDPMNQYPAELVRSAMLYGFAWGEMAHDVDGLTPLGPLDFTLKPKAKQSEA